MRKALLISAVTVFSLFTTVNGQEFGPGAIKLGVGLGTSEGKREIGVGGIVTVGYQHSFFNDRLRVGPELKAGSFLPMGITDQRDQYYRVTTLGVNGSFDVIKIKPVSLFIEAGGNINYSRGLLGTGGMDNDFTGSEYFFKVYYGGLVAAGIRVAPPAGRVSYELTPLTIGFGNDGFMMAYTKFSVAFRLFKK